MALKKRPEILAPAGTKAAMAAAVAAGADAIYFGLEKFNARERAENFTLAELPQIMANLHLRGVKGYVTFNTLLYESELKEAENILRTIARAGADAIIVQDLGIVKLARAVAPWLAVHASTQMTITDAASAEVARALGVSRAIVGRELSAKDIALLSQGTPLDLEVFVHGALCVAYSGQCFTSASWGGRSANRGECAQACRLPYDLIVDGVKRDLGPVKYLLSPLDLMAVDVLPDLIRAGVVSFKIEGRLKSPEYVAATTSLYRKAVDRYFEGAQQDLLTQDERRDLAQVYSRGGMSGFLAGTDHQTILEGTFPRHRGVRVGSVTGHDRKNGRLRVTLSEAVKPGDGLLFTSPAIDPQSKNDPGGRVTAAFDRNGIEQKNLSGEGALEFERKRLSIEDVPLGAVIFRSNDPQLDARLRQIIHEDRGNHPIISMRISGGLDQVMVLEAWDADGHTVKVSSSTILLKADHSSLDEKILREKLARLGQSPFVLGEITIDLPAGLRLPISEINDMRRRAVEALGQARMAHAADDYSTSQVADLLKEPVSAMAAETAQVIALCRTSEHLEGAITAEVHEVILDFMELVGLKKAVERAKGAGLRVGITPTRINKPGEEKILESFVNLQPDEILVRSLGQLEYFSRHDSKIILRGDFSLNAANAITARILLGRGLQSVVPSYDLSMEELKLFFRDFPSAACELVVHQHLPMFHTEYCAYAKLLSPELGFKGTSYVDCGRPCEKHRVALQDRTGLAHPVVVDVGCRNTVFSAQANSVADEMPAFAALGVRRFRVELLSEDRAQAKDVLSAYQAALDGTLSGAKVREQTGAVHRLGVLLVNQ